MSNLSEFFAYRFSFSLIYPVYSIYFHTKFGKTIGKHLTGIVVKTETGQPISLKIAIIRDILPFLASIQLEFVMLYSVLTLNFEPFKSIEIEELFKFFGSHSDPIHLYSIFLVIAWLLLEFIVMSVTKKKQALHDLLANTLVLEVNQKNQFIWKVSRIFISSIIIGMIYLADFYFGTFRTEKIIQFVYLNLTNEVWSYPPF